MLVICIASALVIIVVLCDVAAFMQCVAVCCLIFICFHPITLSSQLNSSLLLYLELLSLNKNCVRKELMVPKRTAGAWGSVVVKALRY